MDAVVALDGNIVKHSLMTASAVLVFLLSFLAAATASASSCPKLGEPILQVDALSYWEAADNSHSKMDFERRVENTRLLQPLRKFQQTISRLSDRAPQDPGSRDCLLQILDLWAGRGALTAEPATASGQFNRSWALGTIGIAIIKARLSPEVRADEAVSRWIRALAGGVVAFTSRRRGITNLSDWSALSIIAASVVMNDEALFSEAELLHERSLAELQDQRIPNPERSRGSRALHYMYFKAEPLFVYEEIRALRRGKRPLPRPLVAFLDMLLPGPSRQLLASLSGDQMKPKELEWIFLYCREYPLKPCMSVETGSNFRLAGRIDVLWSALHP